MLKVVIAMTAVTAFSTASADIARHQMQPKAMPMLESVQVPADAQMLYLSGMLAAPIDPAKAGQMHLPVEEYGDTKTQTLSILTQLRRILQSRGYEMSDVIKLTVFLAGDSKLGGKMDTAGMTAAYKMFFGSAENPNTVVRSTVQVAALAAPGFLVEIEATAAKMPKR